MNAYSSSPLLACITVAISILILRITIVVRSIHQSRRLHSYNVDTTSDDIRHEDKAPLQSTPITSTPIRTMAILGSGGHTTEMIHLLQELDPKVYYPVLYVVAHSDSTSVVRLKRYIDEIDKDADYWKSERWVARYPHEDDSNATTSDAATTNAINSKVVRLPRPREVHQSYLSSILPTIHAIFRTILILWREDPQLILANGPGLCVPLIYMVFVFRVMGLYVLRGLYRRLFTTDTNTTTPSTRAMECRVVFTESLCRVQTLSLSGRLVYPIADQFVVHWPSLKRKYSMVDICDVFVKHDDEEE